MTLNLQDLKEKAERATQHYSSGEWTADPQSPSFIWGESLKGGNTHVAEPRGWGYYTGRGHGALGLSEDEGLAAQYAIQEHIAAFSPSTAKAMIQELEEARAWREEANKFHKALTECRLTEDNPYWMDWVERVKLRALSFLQANGGEG
jgi:hypothetical protein